MILIDIFKPDCNEKKCCLKCKKTFDCTEKCFVKEISCEDCFYDEEETN